MLWPVKYLHETYDNIRQVGSSGGCSVVIYVSLDTDGLCACRILTTLLKSDHISYMIKPVRWQEDIVNDYAETSKVDSIRSIVMLNCGGDLNIEEKLDLDEDVFVYVVDSHRPFHHANLAPSRDKTIVMVTDHVKDDTLVDQFELVRDVTDEEVEQFLLQDDDEEDEEDDEDEDEGDKKSSSRPPSPNPQEEQEEEMFDEDELKQEIEAEQEQREAKRRKLVIEDGEEEDKDEDGSTTKKQGTDGITKRDRVQQYYHGSFWGSPASHVLFTLAEQVNSAAQRSNLWLSIVGTTFHYMNNHLEHDDYQELVMEYQNLARNISSGPGVKFSFAAEDGTMIPIEEPKIEFAEEFRLMLHRHWSLYDAFYYSDFVASKLGIWKANGQEKLNTFFAKLGISLKEARQQFSYVNIKIKTALADKIQEYGDDFDLGTDFTYGSFKYRHGYNFEYSAADIVYCISALLDAYSIASTIIEGGKQQQQQPQPQQEGVGEDEDDNKKTKKNDGGSYDCFNVAYDLLDFDQFERNQDRVKLGLDLSKLLQQAIVEEGAASIAESKIMSAGDFRYCILEGLPPKLLEIFSQPPTLVKLAQFIMLAKTNNQKWVGSSAKPFVLALENNLQDIAYIAGIPAGSGNNQRNQFTWQFQKAANLVQDQVVKHDASIIQVKAASIKQFLTALHSVIE